MTEGLTHTHTHTHTHIHTHTHTHTHIIYLLLFSCSVMSDFLRPHKLQHARLPCPSPSPGAFSYSCPLSQWCHVTISSAVSPLSSCPQSSPASRSFLMSWLFASSGQSIGASASTSILPMNIQDWFPLGLTGSVALHSQESSLTTQFENIKSWALSLLYGPTLTSIHDYCNNHRFDYMVLCQQSDVYFSICCLGLS